MSLIYYLNNKTHHNRCLSESLPRQTGREFVHQRKRLFGPILNIIHSLVFLWIMIFKANRMVLLGNNLLCLYWWIYIFNLTLNVFVECLITPTCVLSWLFFAYESFLFIICLVRGVHSIGGLILVFGKNKEESFGPVSHKKNLLYYQRLAYTVFGTILYLQNLIVYIYLWYFLHGPAINIH